MRAAQSNQHHIHDFPRKADQDGIIIWDQTGVVIRWQDGHCSRFSWQALRSSCACADCQPRGLSAVERNAA